MFFEAKLSTCIYVVENKPCPDQPISINFYPARSFDDDSRSYSLRVSDIANIDPETLSIPQHDRARHSALQRHQVVSQGRDLERCREMLPWRSHDSLVKTRFEEVPAL